MISLIGSKIVCFIGRCSHEFVIWQEFLASIPSFACLYEMYLVYAMHALNWMHSNITSFFH